MRALNKEERFFKMLAGKAERYINRRVNDINAEINK